MSEADGLVFFSMFGVGVGCAATPDACTSFPTMCIDCDAGGEADGDSCVEEASCDCSSGCTGTGEADDASTCAGIGGSWTEAGPKTGCNARDSFMMALMFGDGTEAANAICAMNGGEGTGEGQCEEPDADTGVAGCEWSTDTCVPTAATTTAFTDAWTASKASGMLAAFSGMGEAMAYDCSAGCTCTAADAEVMLAAEASGGEGLLDMSTECLACVLQAGEDEAQIAACMTGAATTCTAAETTAISGMEDGDQTMPEGVAAGCQMCIGAATQLPEADQPPAVLNCLTLTPCSFPDDVDNFNTMLECNAPGRTRARTI